MALKNTHYFASSPDWERYSTLNRYPLRHPPYKPVKLDIVADRREQTISESKWSASHPLSDVGYSSRMEHVQVRDGAKIEIKVSRPIRIDERTPLPLLFVTHGGGWVQGTHVTEEAWLLWPLFKAFDLVVVSVGYRLAPESEAGTHIRDCLDALQAVMRRTDELCFDHDIVILAGSSAGAGIAASLSHIARYHGDMPVQGVLLNVPVLCDYRHFPESEYEYTSYEQCMGALLGGGEMRAVWDMVVPDNETGKSSFISPMLGTLEQLPPHAVFVAGQDPLRDEGIAYIEKLRKSEVRTASFVYPGVPHNFAEFWELDTTERFWGDLISSLADMLRRYNLKPRWHPESQATGL